MQKPATPFNEIQRLEELCTLGVLDTPAEERFDRITRTAQKMFGVPIALISLIDQDRQWFKSRQGLAAAETPRDISFCGHAILGDSVFVIENADADLRFMDNPLVTDAPFVKFYAGVPLNGPNGYKLGTLCIIDHAARQFDPAAIAALKDLAAWAEAELAADYSSRVATACEAQLFNILENTVDGIFTVDEFDLIKAVNPAALRMFHYQQQELVGHNIKKLMTESYHSKQESFIQNYRRINLARTKSKDREMIGKRKDGTPFSIEVILSDTLVLADCQTCFIVIIREISELKLAEKKLRESSQLLNTLMNSTSSYVHVRDLQGRYLYVNKEYETVFNCVSEEIIGKSYADVLPLELAQQVRLSELAIIDTGATLQTENIVYREGVAHTYLVIRSPLLDDNGDVTGTCGVGLDISENKRLEQDKEKALTSLRVSEERWAFALESSGEAVWDCDVPSGKVQLSERWKDMLGYTDAEIGDDVIEWSSRLHPDDVKRVMDDVQDTMDGRSPSYSGEYRLLCKNGSYLWILDRGMVVQRDANGAPLRMVGTQTDISQRKQLERIKTEFISTVSHELRTPLTSIRGSLGLLEAGVLGALPPKALELIKVANKNSQRLISLVNDLLDMDKLLSGKMTMQLHPIDMAALVAQAVEANAAYAASFQVRFAITVPPLSSMATGDADRLMQVLANLLSNAAKFSRSGEVIDIRLLAAGAFFRVEVEDRGEGIPVAFRTRIFEAFAQADSANTRRQGSTGLGLNISKKLIEQMGGEIGYVTEINHGTRFWFTVPMAKD
ncbi:MAG: PAS domain S-box protein [Undibacterium sp.]|nr:PAS domain S-box protein [Undibacterium sp.]